MVQNSSKTSVASFTKEVNPWLAKHTLKTSGRLANHRLTSLVNGPELSIYGIIIGDHWYILSRVYLKILRPKRSGQHFAGDIFKYILLTKN